MPLPKITHCGLALCFFPLSAAAQVNAPTRVANFNTVAAPLIDAFYNAHYTDGRREGGYVFQVVIPLEPLRRIIATPIGTHVRVFSGWNKEGFLGGIFHKDEAQTILWPADENGKAVNVESGIYRIKNNNGCRPYCDFTHLAPNGNPVPERISSLDVQSTLRRHADQYLAQWAGKNPSDPVWDFLLHREVILAMSEWEKTNPTNINVRVYHGVEDSDGDAVPERILIIVPANESGTSNFNLVFKQTGYVIPPGENRGN